MANEPNLRIAGDPGDEEVIDGILQNMLDELPAVDANMLAPREEGANLERFNRNFHMLVHNANMLIAEQFAVLENAEERGDHHAIDEQIVGGIGNVAAGLMVQLRSMIGQLMRQRDQMRQLVIERGLFDPVFGQWDDMLKTWKAKNLTDEQRMHNSPKSLATITLNFFADVIRSVPDEVYLLPDSLLFELYVHLFQKKKFHLLRRDWSNVDKFHRVLKWKMKRLTVHKIFSGMVHKNYLTEQVLFKDLEQRFMDDGIKKNTELFQSMLTIGAFFVDHGSFNYCSKIFQFCQKILDQWPVDLSTQQKILELNYWILKYCTANGLFTEAVEICTFVNELIDKLVDDETNRTLDLTQVLTQCARLWYVIGNYNKAMEFCLKALKSACKSWTQTASRVELLCMTAKMLIFKRHFDLALKSVRFALAIVLGHPEHEGLLCSVLCDYGDCLLHSDNVEMSVQVYTVMAKLVHKYFGGGSFRDGQAMYEYAYATYTLLYSNYSAYSAHRSRCDKYLKKASEIFQLKRMNNHYLSLCTSQLQAVAFVNTVSLNAETQQPQFKKAIKVHIHALNKYSSLSANNVSSAKTYDYLGLIFRCLGKAEIAEEMFEKSLQMKKLIYGPNDHETALTMISLACLYLKDKNRINDAVFLLKKSLEIEIRTFGEECSGLGIIYDGIAFAYETIGDELEARNFRQQFNVWKDKRHSYENEPLKNPFGQLLYIKETFNDFIVKCHSTLAVS
ncbi:unnamed protein product [Thelazia callipaeda]|uniref:TPR_REGION domain-containing protein n=1 Tax=Thelazia callipaeda TaxID=103827 RepID=A0A0N5CVD7_THECL|nr:unnamed protein product [Thelazia callipaeda]